MKIVTAVVNNPTFIEIQYHTLKKHVKGEYEFIVFNDAKPFPDFTNDNDVTLKTKIEELCKTLGIKCINIPNEQHVNQTDAAVRCADSMNFILNYQLAHPDKYLLLDSDMFLIDTLDVTSYDSYNCAIVLQTRDYNGQPIHYMWNGIYYFDIKKMSDLEMLNWNCNYKCDVGAMMYHWFMKQMINHEIPDTNKLRWTDNDYHTNNIYFIKHLWSCSWNLSELPKNLEENDKLIDFLVNDLRNQDGKFFCEIYDKKFLHYRAGGNWRREGMNIHNLLSQKLKNSIV